MDKAKALTGKYAGQPIAANKQGFTHELCREWKLYCPECYQFVHLRKSDKISSYFAHYDVEDKECTDRTKYSSSNTISSIENCAKGQDLEVIQLEFESILFEKYDEFKIDELKDLENITNKCKKYFIANRKNIIKSCAQNNKFKHRGISRDVLNILFIDMNKDILKKLIYYAVAINPECSNQLDNITESTIRSSIDSIIKIIADIDWNKPKSTVKSFTQSDYAWALSECVKLSKQNELPDKLVKLFEAAFKAVPEDIRKPFEVQEVAATEIKETNEIENIEPKIEVIQKPKNIGSIPKPIAVTRPLKVNENNLKLMPNLSVAQKIATLAGLNFQYSHRFTQKGKSDDRYLVYEAIEVSKKPYCVKIVNIGEKKTMDILSITLHPNKLEIKSEIKEEIGDKLTNKDIHDWGRHSITTHYRCVSLIVLPAMIEAAIEATATNLVSPKWLFVALLLERLDLTEKYQLKP